MLEQRCRSKPPHQTHCGAFDACCYQLAFRTPGIIPFSERSRKQMRQSPNFRRNARDRPQRPQRLCCRTWNFGLRFDFSTIALRAIQKHSVFLSSQPTAISHQLLLFLSWFELSAAAISRWWLMADG
jgi:hypothetical protein